MSVAAPVEVMRAFQRPASPYVGLVPFGEDDAAFFFGRSHEAAIVGANLRSSRLTIVYGPSGVGKSSLLQAGVVHGLREESRVEAFEHPFAVCAVRSWLDDPVRTLEDSARTALQELVDEPLPGPGATLVDSLRAWTERAGVLLVVLDQFEEYFQYHPGEGEGERLRGFASELADVVNDPGLAVNVLLSIREDAWAKLDRFEGHIPLLFANYLRIDHLDLEAAGEAIEGPVMAWNRTLPPDADPYDIEPALMGAVLDAARGGLALGGGEAPAEPSAGDRVEAPFLQLVLERLWRATVEAGEHALTLARLEALGGARRIVENHLLEALGRLNRAEQDAASDCFRFLVSGSGTKIAHTAADLGEWTHRPEPEITAVLDRLCSADAGRILRAVAAGADGVESMRYELFHDVLAEPLLAWRRLHEQERGRRAFRRRLARIGSGILALVAVLTALSVWALIERGHANRLFHDQELISLALQKQNDELTKQKDALTKETAEVADAATADTTALQELRAAYASLQEEVRGLRTRRDSLDRGVDALRTQSAQLEASVGRLNDENAALAARITRLDRRNHSLLGALLVLIGEQASLDVDAGILRDEVRALRLQEQAARREWGRLTARAERLGHRVPLPRHTQVASPAALTPPERTTAEQFGIPEAIDLSGTLRRQVEALRRKLARLLEQRARSADEADWLRSANDLLGRQRDALRLEIAKLEQDRSSLLARNAKLRQTLGEARAEHDSLSARASARELRNRTTRHEVGVQRKANARLQDGNSDRAKAIGERRQAIADLRTTSDKLETFLKNATAPLLGPAHDPSQDARLAGLLAVEATLVTPYDPDGDAHPEVYNALWLALRRLDASAARDLIAPGGDPARKVGTTRSALLVEKICGLVSRPLTADEWKRFLPARAPYTPASSRPCP